MTHLSYTQYTAVITCMIVITPKCDYDLWPKPIDLIDSTKVWYNWHSTIPQLIAQSLQGIAHSTRYGTIDIDITVHTASHYKRLNTKHCLLYRLLRNNHSHACQCQIHSCISRIIGDSSAVTGTSIYIPWHALQQYVWWSLLFLLRLWVSG